MKLFKVFDREIHDHYIIIALFVTVIAITYFNIDHANQNNCHILEPDIQCDQRGPIDRNNVTANTQFVFIPSYASLYGLDEFRQKPQFGFMHVECQPNQNNCTYHYDTFNGVVGFGNTFNWIAHAADQVSTACDNGSISVGKDCFGIPDYGAVLLIWAVIIAGGYYVLKHLTILTLHLVKKLD